jgi:hypothetical protein
VSERLTRLNSRQPAPFNNSCCIARHKVTRGFEVDSVYLPASEVGGDFFFVAPRLMGRLLSLLGTFQE